MPAGTQKEGEVGGSGTRFVVGEREEGRPYTCGMSSTVVGSPPGTVRLEVLTLEAVRDQAIRLLRVDALRAADALQLKAARIGAVAAMARPISLILGRCTDTTPRERGH